ncbi:MAG: hypothetical protein CME05_00050 [Gemmatimonadaceae bacterium]|nr:hypothetical protein [Gemmatimonadaceae bacterium]
MSQLHPEMRKIIDLVDADLRKRGWADLHSAGAEAAREFLESWVPPEQDRPPIYQTEDRPVPGPAGDIPVRIFRPRETSETMPVLVWYHGGGWVLGSLDLSEVNCRQLANDADCVVVSVDYRLAPEHPFPAAIEDCLAATAWIHAHADELGADPQRIAVAGDSAGGNLAACVAYSAKALGLPLVLQLLVYPVIDADFERPSYVDNAEGFLLTREAMRFYWDAYVPNLTQRTDPRVAPIHASDLSGVAPAWIITAELDPLRDEAEAYGEALRLAGVTSTTRRYDGMIHAFFNMATQEPVDAVTEATRAATAALREAFEN